MMKKNTSLGAWLLVLFLLSFQLLNAQAIGDYRSKSSGDWTTPGIWEICTTAGTWAGATTATQYPGETTGSYAVTIDHTIELKPPLPIRASNPMGTVTINGTLNLNGDNSAAIDFYINTNVLIVTPPNGTINFINKVNLILNVGIELQVSTGGLTGKCSHNQTIIIGTKTYSYCAGGKNTFEDIMVAGGINTAGTLSGNQNICMGTTTRFTSTVSEGTWSSDQLSIATVNSTSGTVTGIAVGTATIKYTTSSGKISTRVINVNPNLTASVTINGSSNVVCAGTPTSLTFTATPTNGGTAPVYQWKVNGNPVGTNSITFTTSTLLVGDLVTVQMTSNASPCLTNALPVTSTNTITITNQTAIFTGTGWDFTPTANLSAEIRSAFSSGTNDLNFCSLKVTNLAPVVINTGGSFTVQNGVTVESGSLTVESDGNLVQVNNGAVNSGNILVKRNMVFRTTERKEYNYLISPVENANLKTDLYKKADGTAITSPFVLYHNEANNFFYTSSGAYIKGRSLAVKEPLFSSGAVPVAFFNGKPFNGTIDYGLAYSGASFGYNLVGNPYPSNLDLDLLYASNKLEIESTFRFWDNSVNDVYVQQGSTYSGNAYAIYNAAAGTSGTGLPAPGMGQTSGGGSKTPNKIAKIGQGFMVRALGTGKILKYSNTTRLSDNTGAVFFGKQADDRYWLAMKAPSGITSTIAFVYFAAGNMAFGMDDSRAIGSSDGLYSYAQDEKVAINGRSSFVNTDKINLGSSHFVQGNYTIALGDKEGIFANGQTIYLKDKQTGVITNLSKGSYTFEANQGETTGRFEIIYQPETVLVTDQKVKSTLEVYRDSNQFVIRSPKNIAMVEVYDLSGKMINVLKDNSRQVVLDASFLTKGMYVLRIKMTDGELTTKKIIK